MPNVSKVVFGDDTLIDITDTTASPEDVTEGEVFYTANGDRAVGTSRLPIASETVLGGIKVGRNLSIHENGILDATNTEYSEGDGINIEETTISLDIDYLTASRLGFIPTSEKGTNNGVATLNENGKIPSSQISTQVIGDFNLATEDGLYLVRNAINGPTEHREDGFLYVYSNLYGHEQTFLKILETEYKIYARELYSDGPIDPWTEKETSSLPVASSSVLGGVKIGNGINIDNESFKISLDLDYLTASRLGVISSNEKGANDGVATLDENGKVTNSQLPIASENSLGGIKVGQNLSIDENGVLNATGGGGGTTSNWGDIEGDLSNQTDLQSVLDDKPTAIRLTQAEYNALTNEQVHDTTKIYYITDGQSGGGESNIDDDHITTITTFSSSKIMDVINNIVGNTNSVLDTINGEVI